MLKQLIFKQIIMRKLILLPFIALFLSIANLYAEGSTQFFASYTGAGVNRLNITNCLQAVYTTGTAPYKVYAIVAADFDISVASNITFTAHTGYTISIDLPVDRSAALTSTGLALQTKKTADNSLKDIVLYIRKINKANIPYNLNFGSSYPYNTANPDFNGWGYRVVTTNATPQLTSITSTNSFYLAFNPSLGTDSLVCNYYASNDIAQTGLGATISSSSDGVTWTTLKTTNNDLPLNSATAAQKRLALLLPVGTQYIQYLMTAKAGTDPAVNINVITVKHEGVISNSVSSISDLNYELENGPSAEQSFTVSGTKLVGNIVVTPPANFEISTTTGSGFGTAPITLNQSNGTVSSSAIYVRLAAGLSTAEYTGNIALSSTGLATINVAVSGTVGTTGFTTTKNSNLQVIAANGSLKISGLQLGQKIEIYNTVGAMVTTHFAQDGITTIALKLKGVYLVKVGDLARKIVL